MLKQLQMTTGAEFHSAPGKIVCVGRNYAAHAKELDNPIPEEPLLFMKPATALTSLNDKIMIPQGGDCHYETEIALLIGQEISSCSRQEALLAIAGVGLALDLTKRELQSQLKAKSWPWDVAKGFDGACPISAFVPASVLSPASDIQFSLELEGELRQSGDSRNMLFSTLSLIEYISRHFTLLPGDIVLTGTPEGVGELKPGMSLRLSLSDQFVVETTTAQMPGS